MLTRIAQIQALLDSLEADAVWISFLPDIRWACGFSGSNGLLIVRRDRAHFVSDGRYTTQAAAEVIGAEVHATRPDLPSQVKELKLLQGCKRVAYQEDHLTVAELARLRKDFRRLKWVGASELLVRQTAAKEPHELEAMRRAQRITEDAFDSVLALLRPGITEKEVAAELVYQHLRLGAESMSFDPVVAAGPNAALPHARPTDRALRSGEAVLLDFGCFLDGYASDMTRTVFLGQPDNEKRRVYETVLAAQTRAIETARAGMQADELDETARSVIRDAGYAEYYNHGLGHGVGLQIHEWPRVSYTVDYELPADCVVTIEPGIYLPERFGVRIEDEIVLREGGCENLTAARKDLIVID